MLERAVIVEKFERQTITVTATHLRSMHQIGEWIGAAAHESGLVGEKFDPQPIRTGPEDHVCRAVIDLWASANYGIPEQVDDLGPTRFPAGLNS